MRIAHISYAFVTGYNDPGSWLKRLDFYTSQLESMTRYGEVMSFHHIQYDGYLERAGVRYYFRKVRKWQTWFPFRLHKLIRSLNPDVLIVHGLIFPLQVMLLHFQVPRARLFVVHHAERPFNFPKNIFQRIADRFVRGYFFASHELGQLWSDKKLIATKEKIHELILVSSFFKPAVARNAGQKPRAYLWIGRLDANKDPVTLVQAFGLFFHVEPTATLQIVYRGGDLQGKITDMISPEHGRNITMTNDVDHDEISAFCNESAFIISTSHYESSGAAITEGMSCGCIPIVTNIPSFRTMTGRGRVGLTFEPGDVDGLVDVLKRSTTLDLAEHREKVLNHFRDNLSFEAVSKKVYDIISRP